MKENNELKLTQEIVRWLSSKLKPGSCDYIVSQGRAVYIKRANANTWYVVEIPQVNKESEKSIIDFQEAWLNVFKYAKNYLEDEIKIISRDSDFDLKQVNDILGEVRSDTISYLQSLENIIAVYKASKAKKASHAGVEVQKSSVMIGREEPVITAEERRELANDTSKYKEKDSLDSKRPVVKKVTDDYTLDETDFSKFKEENVDLLLVPCQDWKRKSDRLFMQNVESCKREGFPVGTFVYGKSIDSDMAFDEVKKIYELLDRVHDSITNLIVYAVNDDYIRENASEETKIIKFIEMYSKISTELDNFGYEAIISMNIDSKEIIDEVIKKFDLVSEVPILYTVMPKEKDKVSSDESIIVVDPRNEHDEVVIKDEKLIKDIDNQILKGNALSV